MNAPARHTANGFSLVELMVALFVMGLLAAVAVLTLGSSDATLRNDAERFAARTQAARDQAVVGGAPVAVTVGGAGYYFQRRTGGQWAPLDQQNAAPTAWSEGTAVAVSGGDGRSVRLVFDQVGLASEDMSIVLRRGEGQAVVKVGRDGAVRIDGPAR